MHLFSKERFLIAAVIKQLKRIRKHISGFKILQNIIVTITFLNLTQTVNSCRQGLPPQKKMAEKGAEGEREELLDTRTSTFSTGTALGTFPFQLCSCHHPRPSYLTIQLCSCHHTIQDLGDLHPRSRWSTSPQTPTSRWRGSRGRFFFKTHSLGGRIFDQLQNPKHNHHDDIQVQIQF